MNQGQNVLLLSPDKKHKILRSDTEYGKTIDELEYKYMKKDTPLPIDVIVPLEKFSQLEISDTDVFHLAGFGGDNHRTIFNITYDTRDPHQIVKDDSSKAYVTGPPITAISTSIDGYVVTGDAFGCIRLYNDLSKNAIAKLDGLEGVSSDEKLYPKGDPVIGIDISTDKKWVVWTCPSYLAIIYFDDPSQWEKSKGMKKPQHMLLSISKEHLGQYNIKKYTFLPAKFDVGPSRDLKKKDIIESYIFSYIGDYRFVWNMRQVMKDYKAGKTESYGTISKVENTVTDYAPEYGRPGVEESVISFGDVVKHLKF